MARTAQAARRPLPSSPEPRSRPSDRTDRSSPKPPPRPFHQRRRSRHRGRDSFFMALPFFVEFSTPSLPAQGEQRRSSYFNIHRDIPSVLPNRSTQPLGITAIRASQPLSKQALKPRWDRVPLRESLALHSAAPGSLQPGRHGVPEAWWLQRQRLFEQATPSFRRAILAGVAGVALASWTVADQIGRSVGSRMGQKLPMPRQEVA